MRQQIAHTRTLLLLMTGLLLPAVALGQNGIDSVLYETVLLPVVNRPTPGAYGSLWESRFVMYNGNVADLDPNPVQPDIYPLDHGCRFPACNPIPLVPGLSRHEPLLFRPEIGHPSGLLLFVKREFADQLSYSLRIQDVSRQELTWGTEIRVVRERDLITTAIDLLEVPTDERFRQALRIYDPDARTESNVQLEVFDVNDERLVNATLTLQPPALLYCGVSGVACYPSTVEILNLVGSYPQLLGFEPVRLKITALTPGLRLWAFVSVTNNETQHVTTITPQ